MSKFMFKLHLKFYSVSTLFFLPGIASADVFTVIDQGTLWFDAITVLFLSAAIAVFFWGLVKFIWHAGDEKTLEDGKKMMIWSLVGIAVIFSMWAIVGFIQESLDIGGGGGGTTPGIRMDP